MDCDSDLGSVAFVFVCCIFVFAESVSDLAPDARTDIIRLILSLFFLLPQCCPIFLNVAQCFSKLPLRSNKPGKRKLMAPKQSQSTKSKRGGFCIFCILWERENATKRNLLFWSTCLPRGNELCRIEKSSEIQSFATKKSSLTGNWFCFPICGTGFESGEETSFAESLLWKKSK